MEFQKGSDKMGKARKELAEIRHAFESIEGYEYAEDDTVFTFVTRIYGDVCRERDQARQTVAMQVISGQINHDEQLPNPRLIAAAPDLLKVCEAMIEIIDAQTTLLTCYRIGRNPSEKTLDTLTVRYDVEQQAKDVIAKARGESNE